MANEELEEKQRFKNDNLRLLLLIAIPISMALFLYSFPLYARDMFVLVIIVAIIILLFIFAYNTKGMWRITFISLGFFSLFHLILFPFIYLWLLSQNPKAMEFDGYAKETGKADAVGNLNSTYSIEELKTMDSVINMSNKNNDSFFLIPMKLLIEKDTFHYPYWYGLRWKSQKGIHRPPRLKSLTIFNSKKKELATFLDMSGGNYFMMKQLLSRESKSIKDALTEYHEEEKLISKSHFWGYKSILPYTLNITLGGNVKCQSPAANIIYFIHYCIVWVLIISFVSSSVYTIISSAKPRDKDDEYSEYSNK